jgi:alkylated DNA nucleotide flippase Atl1
MKVGDLVRWSKTSQIGIAIDIFGDLDPVDPWIRVVFQKGELQTFQWCKQSSLNTIKKEGAETDPFS